MTMTLTIIKKLLTFLIITTYISKYLFDSYRDILLTIGVISFIIYIMICLYELFLNHQQTY